MTTTEYRHYIGGDWTTASAGATFEDLNPYSGEVVATVVDQVCGRYCLKS